MSELSISMLDCDDEPILSEDDALVLIHIILNDKLAAALPTTAGYRKALLDVIQGLSLAAKEPT